MKSIGSFRKYHAHLVDVEGMEKDEKGLSIANEDEDSVNTVYHKGKRPYKGKF